MTIKINYVKVHFLTTCPKTNLLEKYFRVVNNIKVAEFLNFPKLKITLMGRKFQYVNVTGASKLSYVISFKKYYLSLLEVEILSDISIDSISAAYKFKEKSKTSFKVFRKNLADFKLTIKDNSKFPGVVIRNNFQSKGGCAIYFRSGSLNFLEFKHPKDIFIMKEKIKSALF